jgi:hypothetical protein
VIKQLFFRFQLKQAPVIVAPCHLYHLKKNRSPTSPLINRRIGAAQDNCVY